MRAALLQYQENTRRTRDLVGLASTLSNQTTTVLDITDIYRAAMVLAVSALDHLVHEVARKGMLEAAGGGRPSTDAFKRFQISMDALAESQVSSGNMQWLDAEIRRKHAWQSFQDPDKIAEAVRLVSHKQLWSEVGIVLGLPASNVKERLKLIVDRRNKIGHEADMDPSYPGVRWPIDSALVLDSIDFLDRVAAALIGIVT